MQKRSFFQNLQLLGKCSGIAIRSIWSGNSVKKTLEEVLIELDKPDTTYYTNEGKRLKVEGPEYDYENNTSTYHTSEKEDN